MTGGTDPEEPTVYGRYGPTRIEQQLAGSVIACALGARLKATDRTPEQNRPDLHFGWWKWRPEGFWRADVFRAGVVVVVLTAHPNGRGAAVSLGPDGSQTGRLDVDVPVTPVADLPDPIAALHAVSNHMATEWVDWLVAAITFDPDAVRV